jgi:hypothetical protein
MVLKEVGYTLGTLGGLWYLGDKLWRFFEGVYFNLVKKPKAIVKARDAYQSAELDSVLYHITAGELQFLTGKFPDDYKPHSFKVDEIVRETFEKSGFAQDPK